MNVTERSLETIADVFDDFGTVMLSLHRGRYIVTQLKVRTEEPSGVRALAVLLPGYGAADIKEPRSEWRVSGNKAGQLAELIMPYMRNRRKKLQLAFFLEARRLAGWKRGKGYETTAEDIEERQVFWRGYRSALKEFDEVDEIIGSLNWLPPKMAKRIGSDLRNYLNYTKRVTPEERGTF